MTHGLPFGRQTYVLPKNKLFQKHQKHIEIKREVGR
jgi:hypothetical protein